MKASSTINALRTLILFALLCVCACPFLASCSSEDDPDMTNEYYLVVQTRETIYRRGGLPPDPKNDMIGLITTRMMDTITSITQRHAIAGELIVHDSGVQRSRDSEILVACDELYDLYLQTGFKDRTVCTASLYRAKKLEGIVRRSKHLKTYRF